MTGLHPVNIGTSSLKAHVRCGGFVFIVVHNLPKEYKGYIHAVTGPDCFKNQTWKYSEVNCISNVSVLICSLIEVRVFNKPSFVTSKFFVKTSVFF